MLFFRAKCHQLQTAQIARDWGGRISLHVHISPSNQAYPVPDMTLEQSSHRISLSIALSNCCCWPFEVIVHLVESVKHQARGQ
jgi:hypothetical protein